MIFKFSTLTFFSAISLMPGILFAQETKKEKLANAVKQLLAEKDMKYGSLSFTVLDASSNKEVYTYNPNLGLPAASTQKIITAITAYEVLGANFKYQTNFYLRKDAKVNTILVNGNYDPTLGSYRYSSTKSDIILETLKKKLAAQNIHSAMKLKFSSNVASMDINNTSDAWIFEDLGNYYGAPCSPLIWRENKYDVYLDTKSGSNTTIKSTSPAWLSDMIRFENRIKVGAIESGDNSCLYKYPFNNSVVGMGSIGKDLDNQEVSGSVQGEQYFWYNLNNFLNDKDPASKLSSPQFTKNFEKATLLYQHTSPSLDSINYWFLKKSVNLYGESLLRTLGMEKYKNYDYQKGIHVIANMAQKIGVDSNAIHIFDGSGLSPQNRISSNALCQFMQFARNQKYYKQFYSSLPIINDISMKSGSIHGVRAYTGYISGADNNIYTFAIVANNFTCSGKEMQSKLWKILDVLK
jgi:serine-type D-Ala-D-Ala carboxypeptidase/endopeptidase (penicillin-binding protein 4)